MTPAERAAVPWQPIDDAPRDGTSISVLYDNGDAEDGVYWSRERYCVLGAPQGSFGPGWVSTDAGHLPVGDDPYITHFRALAATPPGGEP